MYSVSVNANAGEKTYFKAVSTVVEAITALNLWKRLEFEESVLYSHLVLAALLNYGPKLFCVNKTAAAAGTLLSVASKTR